MAPVTEKNTTKKRKLQDVAEIEIDVSAPEPPSKKALRQAKKKQKGVIEAPSEAVTEEQTNGTDEAVKPEKKQRSDHGIWIGNLAFSTTKDDLRKFLTANCSFSDATITRVHLPRGPTKNGASQNKGFAYIDFSTSKAVQEALALSEQLVLGRYVLIKDARSFEGRPEKAREEQATGGSTNSGNPPSKRIFVGNLGFDVTKEILQEHFEKCGTVENVHVATFQDSGKCKGYAWVVFEDLAAAVAAVRGFVLVNEDDEDDQQDTQEDSGSGSEARKPAKPRKGRQRKMWVNQLQGRRIRMEFAEDASTRYKKRFGKESKGKKNEDLELNDVEEDKHTKVMHSKPSKGGNGTGGAADQSRYAKDTVQRLSGAIVQSKGTKITFD